MDLRSISIKKHEWEFGNIPQENMKWDFANFGIDKNPDRQCLETYFSRGSKPIFKLDHFE